MDNSEQTAEIEEHVPVDDKSENLNAPPEIPDILPTETPVDDKSENLNAPPEIPDSLPTETQVPYSSQTTARKKSSKPKAKVKKPKKPSTDLPKKTRTKSDSKRAWIPPSFISTPDDHINTKSKMPVDRVNVQRVAKFLNNMLGFSRKDSNVNQLQPDAAEASEKKKLSAALQTEVLELADDKLKLDLFKNQPRRSDLKMTVVRNALRFRRTRRFAEPNIVVPENLPRQNETRANSDAESLSKVETESPVTLKPETEPPVTSKPEMEPPVTSKPETEPPVIVKPETESLVNLESETEPPVTPKPEMEPPVTPKPGTEPLVTFNPETESQVNLEPKTESPVTLKPKTEPPVTSKPETESPVTLEPNDQSPPITLERTKPDDQLLTVSSKPKPRLRVTFKPSDQLPPVTSKPKAEPPLISESTTGIPAASIFQKSKLLVNSNAIIVRAPRSTKLLKPLKLNLDPHPNVEASTATSDSPSNLDSGKVPRNKSKGFAKVRKPKP